MNSITIYSRGPWRIKVKWVNSTKSPDLSDIKTCFTTAHDMQVVVINERLQQSDYVDLRPTAWSVEFGSLVLPKHVVQQLNRLVKLNAINN